MAYFGKRYVRRAINKRVVSYLFGGIGVDKHCINIFGRGQQLCLRINVLVVFTGQPELDVFFTELRPEELSEGSHSVCNGQGREKVKTNSER